jgi:hypothetical protein
MNLMARDARARFASLVLVIWLALALPPSPLRAEPLDRQVAEWVILMGGSVRLEGQEGLVRELTQLPAADFRLELADLGNSDTQEFRGIQTPTESSQIREIQENSTRSGR